MKEALDLLGNAVHLLQKERGYIALYLGSGGRRFLEQMQAQFELSDQAILEIREASVSWHERHQIKTLNKLDHLLKKMDCLVENRAQVTSDQPSSYSLIHFYTYEIIAPILEVMVEVALFNPRSDSRRVSAYNNFIQWKERIGRERAAGALGFSESLANQEEFIEELKVLVIEQ